MSLYIVLLFTTDTVPSPLYHDSLPTPYSPSCSPSHFLPQLLYLLSLLFFAPILFSLCLVPSRLIVTPFISLLSLSPSSLPLPPSHPLSSCPIASIPGATVAAKLLDAISGRKTPAEVILILDELKQHFPDSPQEGSHLWLMLAEHCMPLYCSVCTKCTYVRKWDGSLGTSFDWQSCRSFGPRCTGLLQEPERAEKPPLKNACMYFRDADKFMWPCGFIWLQRFHLQRLSGALSSSCDS